MTPLTRNALPGILRLEPYKPGMPLDELQRRLGIVDAIKLASNENPLGPSPRVREAVARFVADTDLALYPDGGGFRLKARLAEMHGIEPERITLGNGSNDLLEFLGRIYLGPGRSAMFSRHAFAVYPIVTQAQNAESVVVPALPPEHPMAYGHDLAGFRRHWREDISLVFIANPNNPTGTWLPAAEIEAFLDFVPPHVLVILDEAYWEYLDPADRGPVRAWLERYPNLVVTHTFSKTYGLASLRAGYGLSSVAVADLMNRVRQPFNNNSLALVAAEAALADQDHVRASVALNTRERTRMVAALTQLGLRCLPSQANFLAVDFGRVAAPIHQKLLERGIIVRPMASYEMPNFLRITIGTPAQNDRLLAVLPECLA
ncbi:MAG TPA: histidinol-phosphate transaminase [Nevskiaceae bacterium]|nr:histidinol-phosphate transaminase [Nevskiaceae bacterium]